MIGLVIFLLDLLFVSTQRQNVVVIYDDEVESLISSWTEQVGRPPNKDEINKIVNQLIDEEILYKEAIKLGLDKNDIIIKRRLAQKLNFLRQEVESSKPSDSELRDYFLENKTKYIQEVKFSFTHLYFSRDKNGKKRAKAAVNLLLNQSDNIKSDPFLLGKNFSLKTLEEIERIFGNGFSHKFKKQKLNKWLGPYDSIYGTHFIKIINIVQSREPELEEVYDLVLMDLKIEQQQKEMKNYLTGLRNTYEIVVNSRYFE